MKAITLHDGRERSLLRRHPWVFESSIASGRADSGETVRVQTRDGRFLAWAAYSPNSMIRLRAWSLDEAERIDAAFFARRIASAIAARDALQIDSDGVRLIHGEADGLPGLVVDRYGDTLCAQITSAAAERWKDTIAAELLKATGAAHLYERSDASVRSLEGLAARTGWVTGAGQVHESTQVTIREHGWRFEVDLATGHKTGFYLDQRDNRRIFADTVRRFGFKRVLNCFCYTGGFSVAALAGGATDVTSVDSSGPALVLADAHVALNGFDPAHHRTLDADVNRTLREMLDRGDGCQPGAQLLRREDCNAALDHAAFGHALHAAQASCGRGVCCGCEVAIRQRGIALQMIEDAQIHIVELDTICQIDLIHGLLC